MNRKGFGMRQPAGALAVFRFLFAVSRSDSLIQIGERLRRNRERNGTYRHIPVGLPRSSRSSAGFTLLEVLVSLAVLALGAVLTLSLISGSLGNIRKVQQRTRTIEHAQSVMELALLDDSIRQPVTFTGNFEDGTRWSVRVEEYFPAPLPQAQPGTPTELPVKLLCYTVEVTSPESRGPDYRLQTLKLSKGSAEAQPSRMPDD